MTSIIRLTPLSGAQDEAPLCYLLQVDEFRFLLDCGWDENLNPKTIENIARHVQTVDAVLLSHPDIYHLGALPYLVGKCNLNCPIYATIPVYKMGQMFLYDFYQSRQNYQEFEEFTLDDVDTAFDKIVQLKYSQHVNLKGRGHGLSITPFAAGHMIGGTMWKIMKEGEEDIIYAVDYNHKKEIHLNGAVLETLSRPALLITDAYATLVAQERRKERDSQLLNTILTTVRGDGNVLLAVDTSGRILELMQLLEQMWTKGDSPLSPYTVVLLNNVSYNVVEFAKSQVEWMSDRMMKSFEVDRKNPFAFKYIQQCHTIKEVDQLPSPKVVLASSADMTSGFSRELFVKWAADAKNSVIFTFKTSPGTLARTLIDNPKIESVELEVFKRIELEGLELSQFLEAEKEKARIIKMQRKSIETDASRLENVFKEESESEDDEEEEDVVNKSKYDLMLTNEKFRHKSSFFKQAKIYPMFPYKEERLKWDDYGEIIKPEDYMIIEDVIMEEEQPKQTSVQDVKEDMNLLEIKKPPTKSISEIVKVDVRCKISYIDFEGRSDGESVRRILSLVKPRQLILIHGCATATEALSRYCQVSSQFHVSKIYTPVTNEVVDATRESHIYQVKLKDSLVSSLKFSTARDAELAWLDGQLVLEARGEKFEQLQGEKQDVVPVLEQIPQEMVTGHATVFVDEPRLSDFKQVLMKAGIQAEFNGGILVCNNVVAVRRGEQGRISIEGGLCEEYYTIRQLLYDQYAIV